jgi:hypothetical protein
VTLVYLPCCPDVRPSHSRHHVALQIIPFSVLQLECFTGGPETEDMNEVESLATAALNS